MINKIQTTLIGAIATITTGLVGMGSAQAFTSLTSFTFSCTISSDCAGNEGGILNIGSEQNGSNFTYTIEVNNTSFNALITGFGFDFTPDFDISLISDFSATRIGSDGSTLEDVTSKWKLSEGTSSVSSGSSQNGINLDFIDFDADQTKSVNDYAIANYSTFDGFFSFKSTQDLTATAGLLRLQRTGTDGNGSLKLVDQTPEEVPEPMTILGTMFAGGFGYMMKRKQKRS
jgi:hypothetical protein